MREKKVPPKLALWLLRRLLSGDMWAERSGDLTEAYRCIAGELGPFRAGWWFRFQVIKAAPGFMLNSFFWSLTMLTNYIKMMFRTLRRQKGHTIINVAGLVVGLTCFILLMLYVQFELSYDLFHDDVDRIYRVTYHLPQWNFQGSTEFAATTGALAPALMEEYPQVESATRIQSMSGPITHQEKTYFDRGFYADEEFLKLFTFPLISGDINRVLSEPNTMVVSQKFARKFFGSDNPVGKVVSIVDEGEFRVTGVMADIPGNSHIQFNFLASFATLISRNRESVFHWDRINYKTYVKLREGVDAGEFESRLVSLVESHLGYDSEEMKQAYYLQPLKRVHLHSNLNFDFSTNSDIKYVYLFGSIAVVILVIGGINTMNLATARAMKRFREVGIRKTIGARRPQLIGQFLGESVLLTALAGIASLGFVAGLLPYFSHLVGREIGLNHLTHWTNIAVFPALILMVGFLSGGYSALIMSTYRPVNALKSATGVRTDRGRMTLRNVLVVFQFCVSVILMVSALVIQKQLGYIKTGDAGYNKENIVAVRMWENETEDRAPLIKEDLLKDSRILGASLCSRIPVHITNVGSARVEGEREGEMLTVPQINCAYVDEDYAGLFDLKIVQGRNFSPDYATDRETGVIINETTARDLGIENPVGRRFSRWDVKEGRIIGVVRDFHFATFKMRIEPVFLLYRPERAHFVSIRIAPGQIRETLDFIEETFKRHSPGCVFDFAFVDETFNSIYKADERMGTVVTLFSGVAVFIAAMGLFGLISFVAENKTREVGIRKVLGASLPAVLRLLTGEFILLVVISNLIAVPASWYLMSRWLEEFVYRIDLTAEYFILAGSAALLIALITVSWRAVKAAGMNPVESLRYE